jgi:PIN domain nuclease of toxin-antitoxin system
MSSASPLLLDTHIWLDFINASPKLRPATIASIESARASGSAFVSVISVWETTLLVRFKRIHLHSSVARWTEDALKLPGVNLLPLTPEIAIESESVDLLDPMHKDPADRILIASARVERLTLVTRDRDILAFANAIKLACLQA